MKSSIKITFSDVHGNGIEPIIQVNIINSDDPRDGLIKALFQSTTEYLQIKYTNHKHITINDNPDMDKTLILFAPKPSDEQILQERELKKRIATMVEANDTKAMIDFFIETGTYIVP